MEHKFWHERWANNEISFHSSEVNPYLLQFAPQVYPAGSTIFVPLCGKTLDMIHLARLGHNVIGVELSPLAVEQFFKEQHLTPEPGPTAGSFRARELPITIWCGDFFAIPAPLLKNINAIYDRASLIALPAPMRQQYAQVMKTLLASRPSCPYFLVGIQYDDDSIGPPFSVTAQEIDRLFGPQFKSKMLAGKNMETSVPRLLLNGIESMHVYCLQIVAV